MRWWIPILLAAALGERSQAADLTVAVRTPRGEPVRDAVVTLEPSAKAARPPVRFSWPQEVSQRDLQFDPFVLITPLGADVAFPNHDNVRHHVYSFSPAKRFELKLYAKGEAPSVRFDKLGVVAVGCNIHDGMVAFIKVVDTPYAAKTDASGVVVLHGVPAGAATLRVWHPYMRAPGNETAREVTLADGANSETAGVELRAPPLRHSTY